MSSYSPEYNVVSSISIRALPRFAPRDASPGPSPYGLHPNPLLQLKSALFIGSSKNLKDKPRVRAEMRITAHILGYHVTWFICLLQKSSVFGGTREEKVLAINRKLWQQFKQILVRATEMISLVVLLTRLRDIQIDGKIWLLSVFVRMLLDVGTLGSLPHTWTSLNYAAGFLGCRARRR